jgi:hypothetical protein
MNSLYLARLCDIPSVVPHSHLVIQLVLPSEFFRYLPLVVADRILIRLLGVSE